MRSPWPRLALALPILAAARAFVPIRDPDVFWHLAMGRAIVATGSPEPPDPLSFTQEGAPFANLTWVWDVGSYGVWRAAGLVGMQAVAVVCLALGLLGAARLGGRSKWAAALLGVGLLGAFGRALPRPDALQLVAPVWMAVAAEGLVYGSGGGPVALGVGLALLWPHLHGSFPMGWVVLAAWMGEGWLRGRPLRRVAIVLGVAVLAPALHPIGWMGAVEKVLGQVDRGALPVRVAEWEPMDWARLGGVPGPLHALLVLGVVGAAGAIRRGRGARWALVAVAAAYLGMALRASRFEGAAAIVGTAAAIAGAGEGGGLALLAGVGALGITLVAIGRVPEYGVGAGAAPSEEPEPLLRALTTLPGDGHRVLSDFDLGAVIGWRLAPAWKVAMDSRAEAFYGTDAAAAYVRAMQGGPGLAAFEARWPIDAAVVHRRSGACVSLAGDAGWRAVTFGADFAVFLREGTALTALSPCGVPWTNVERCARAAGDPGWRAEAVAEAERLAVDGDAFLHAQAGLVRLACGGDPGGADELDRAVEMAPRDMAVRSVRARARRSAKDPRWEEDVVVLDVFAPAEADAVRRLGYQ